MNGKLPPQDNNLEMSVLGTIIAYKDSIYQASQILKPGTFYNPMHNFIYDAILDLCGQRKQIDILSVTNYLREKNHLDYCGGAYYISQLTSNISSGSGLEDHCKILYEIFLKRTMIELLMKSVQKLDSNYEDDIFEAYNNLSAEMSQLFELSLSSDYHNMIDVISSRLNEISEIKPDQNNIIGIDSGFSKLNNFANGFQQSDYIIIGARPSMGKTIIAILIAKAAIFNSKKKVLFFSLEMDKKRIADRILAIENNIDSKRISSNRLTDIEWKELDNSMDLYKNKNFFIIDSSNLSIEDIKARAITLHRKFGIDEIIIDYIGLIKHSFPKKNTVENVTHISKNIKSLAKEIKCPVIALSQLNRAGNDMPVMKDLRDCGSLEQDADIVWLLHREDYEGKECDSDSKNVIINIIAKNRNGEIGSFYTYRNDNWSYIGETQYDDFKSLATSMPFNYSNGIEQSDDVF